MRPAVRASLQLLLCATALLASSGCATARRGAPLAPGVEPQSPASRQGRLTFARNCYSCHGHGEGGLGPAINDKPLPGFLIKTQVRQGLGAMPAFDEKEIPEASLDGLIVYLGELRRSARP
jgi:mono/diheme cytochrome c family protein